MISNYADYKYIIYDTKFESLDLHNDVATLCTFIPYHRNGIKNDNFEFYLVLFTRLNELWFDN